MPPAKYKGNQAEMRRLRHDALSYRNSEDGTTCTLSHERDGLDLLEIIAPIDPQTSRANHEYMRRFREAVIDRERDVLFENLIVRAVRNSYNEFFENSKQLTA